MSELFIALTFLSRELTEWLVAEGRQDPRNRAPFVTPEEFFSRLTARLDSLVEKHAAFAEEFGSGFAAVRGKLQSKSAREALFTLRGLLHKIPLDAPKGVRITDDDALSRITVMEGEAWVQYQSEKPRSEHGFQNALDQHRGGATFSSIIYGLGGWNRYFVRPNGEIQFSERHGPDNVRLAKALGFNIAV